MKSTEIHGEITGISIRGQENMLVSVKPYDRWGERTPEITKVEGACCVRCLDGELQIARDPDPGDAEWEMVRSAPLAAPGSCTIELGSNWKIAPPAERYVNMKDCIDVSMRLEKLVLGGLWLDRRINDTGHWRPQAITLDGVDVLEEAAIHVEGGSFYARDTSAPDGIIVAHDLIGLELHRSQGFSADTRRQVCPGPEECYNRLFEPS